MPREVILRFPPSEEPVAARDRERLVAAASLELGLPTGELAEVRARRISFDARRRHREWRVAADVWLVGEEVPPGPVTSPPTFARPAEDAPQVVVVGSGPAGLFGAHALLEAGLRVTLLERGGDVRARRRPIAELQKGRGPDPENNYCFGEGGAGTYSDGKLYTRAGRKPEVRAVLESLVAHGATPEILSNWRPHVGSNKLPEVVQALCETIRRSGGELYFGARVEQLLTERDAEGTPTLSGLVVRDLESDQLRELAADAVLLATGHSALDSLLMARDAGARLAAKGFAMGVRAEHPQPWLDSHQYGGLGETGELPASFYELTAQVQGRGVYSFCMCPGGWIVPSSTEPGRLVVNGMSLSRRDSPFANAGLVVAIEPEDWCAGAGEEWGWPELLERAASGGDPLLVEVAGRPLPGEPTADPLFGVRLQRALETLAARAGGGAHRAPSQRIDLFLEGQADDGIPESRAVDPQDFEPLPTSYRPGLRPVDLRALLPRGIAERLAEGLREFDRSIPGFASAIGQLVGVETRTSSPVRIARDRESLESEGLRGLWPAGEGAGYAGGIVSAAIDGRRVAASIAARHCKT